MTPARQQFNSVMLWAIFCLMLGLGIFAGIVTGRVTSALKALRAEVHTLAQEIGGCDHAGR